ncbi:MULTISPECIES: Bor family protein [Vibrio]|uniref:Bor family protein n=1 Tax=Vibrio bivalvicida TaxID=1276888 RepID=A0A177XWC5_9VIBR|nr:MULTISPECIES: Bor family protein [Vibrio]KLN62912.1 lipoprotein bor [Vibrio sp. VPAP30]OAJ92901.1 lipoprotein bor [Vibrio bivalvicida]
MKKLVIAAAIALLASGCAQQTFVVAPAETNEATELTSHHFFVSGIGQSKQIDAAQVCGSVDKVAKVETQQTFKDIVFSTITFGIYTPREARVYCK